MVCGAGSAIGIPGDFRCCLLRPSHALHFATYESAKELYGANYNGHRPLATALAGATAVVVHDGCMTPADVIKQRLQVCFLVRSFWSEYCGL